MKKTKRKKKRRKKDKRVAVLLFSHDYVLSQVTPPNKLQAPAKQIIKLV